MKQIQYSVNTTKSSKSQVCTCLNSYVDPAFTVVFSQALEVIKKLREVMPIKRTKMLLRIHFNAEGKYSSNIFSALLALLSILTFSIVV